MNRLLLVTALLFTATACDSYGPSNSEDSAIDWTGYGPELTTGRLASSSYIDMQFNGMYLRSNADVGVAGMAGMTCEYFTALGSTGTDVDVTDGTETVDDGRPADGIADPFGDSVVVLGHSDDDEIHEVGMPSGTIVNTHQRRGSITSRYVPEGIAVLRSELEVGCLIEVIGASRTAVPGHFCAGETTMLSTSDGLLLVDAQGAVDVTQGVATGKALRGSLAALDNKNDRVLTVWDDQLFASDHQGALVWGVNLGGEIQGLTPLGDQFLVSVRTDYRLSRLVIVNASGDVVSDQAMQREAGRVYASADGKKAALAGRSWSDAFTVSGE